jgi:DNA topoisomerase I
MKIKKTERILLDPGYRQAYQPMETVPPVSKADSKLGKLKRGQTVQARQVRIRQRPTGLSEVQLLRALAVQGIGRPSTYAEIVGDLLKRKYIRQEGKQLVLTPRGLAVQDYLSQAFPQLFDLRFSGDLERDLDALAQGKASYRQIVGKVWHLVEKA